MIRRRLFLKQFGLTLPAVLFMPADVNAQPTRELPTGSVLGSDQGQELSADIVIVGGGLGGCAAVLSAARNGLKTIVTEETDWIGGQLTAQGVPPDENPWIESFGGTRSYQELR